MAVVPEVQSNRKMVKQSPMIEISVVSPMSIEKTACSHQIDTNGHEDTEHHFVVFSAK